MQFSVLKFHISQSCVLFTFSLGARVLRPVVSAVPLCPQTNFIVPLCPHADKTERLVRPVVSAVPLCPRWIFIVPLCPHADKTERLVRPVVSAVPLCPQTNFIVPLCPHVYIYTYVGTIFNSLYVS